jgi:hypothetical protein
VEAAEAVKAWADARSLAALRRLHEAVGMVVQEQADIVSIYGTDVVSSAAVADETTTAAVDEVALATGLSEGQVAARLSLATNSEERATPLLAALARRGDPRPSAGHPPGHRRSGPRHRAGGRPPAPHADGRRVRAVTPVVRARAAAPGGSSHGGSGRGPGRRGEPADGIRMARAGRHRPLHGDRRGRPGDRCARPGRRARSRPAERRRRPDPRAAAF